MFWHFPSCAVSPGAENTRLMEHTSQCEHMKLGIPFSCVLPALTASSWASGRASRMRRSALQVSAWASCCTLFCFPRLEHILYLSVLHTCLATGFCNVLEGSCRNPHLCTLLSGLVDCICATSSCSVCIWAQLVACQDCFPLLRQRLEIGILGFSYHHIE